MRSDKLHKNIKYDKLINEELMRKDWDYYEEYKQSYPKPNLKSIWNNIIIKTGINDKKLLPTILKYAAAIIILLGISTVIFFTIDTFNQKNQYISYTAPEGNRTKINLPDGSTVWLQPNSQIKFAKNFNEWPREINFSGHAYFKIAHQQNNPFIIKMKNANVRVLGTQFYIKANENEDLIETGLISGEIKISTSTSEEILSPNDVITISKTNNQSTQKQTLKSKNYTFNNGSIIFDNCTLGNILKDLAELYDIQIEIEKGIDTNKNLTLTVKEESIEEILEIIKIVLPFDYYKKNNKIIILRK
ncbi:MAG: FecR family protein [Thiohalospira sp.]